MVLIACINWHERAIKFLQNRASGFYGLNPHKNYKGHCGMKLQGFVATELNVESTFGIVKKKH